MKVGKDLKILFPILHQVGLHNMKNVKQVKNQFNEWFKLQFGSLPNLSDLRKLRVLVFRNRLDVVRERISKQEILLGKYTASLYAKQAFDKRSKQGTT